MLKDKFNMDIEVGSTILFSVNWLGAPTIRFGRVLEYVNDYTLEVLKVDFGKLSLDETAVKIGPKVRLSRPDSIIVIDPESSMLPLGLNRILSSEDMLSFDEDDLSKMKEGMLNN